MYFFAYYLIVLPLSLLPFRMLYTISDLMCFIVRVLAPYRKKVILTNLRNSFPEKNELEINRLCNSYYAFFCDLMAETIKSFSISRKELLERMKIVNPEFLNAYYSMNQSLLVATGHYGNWEWAAMALGVLTPYKTAGVYKNLHNPFFDKKIHQTRGRFGFQLVSVRKILPYLEKNKNKMTFTAFICDQTPHNTKTCHWMTFLNQDTAVLTGIERVAMVTNHPVVFGKISRPKRGYYEIEFVKVCDKPSSSPPWSITEKHTRMLEGHILKKPEYWLWSHRRWKRKRTSPDNLQKHSLNE